MPIDYGTNEIIASGNINLGNIQISDNTIAATNTNGNIIVQSNGTGALQRDSGGNARGIYAVDLQNLRLNDSRVASGYYSVISGGSNNTASGSYSTVSGGRYCSATDSHSVVGGGTSNSADGTACTIGGGNGNDASGNYSTVSGGRFNTAAGYNNTVSGGRFNEALSNYSTVGGGNNNTSSNSYSTVGGGFNNNTSGYISTIGGGRNNTASGNYSTISGGLSNIASGKYSSASGRYAIASYAGEQAYAGAKFNTSGDAQHRRFILTRLIASDDSDVFLYLPGNTTTITVPENCTWVYQVTLVARCPTLPLSIGMTFAGVIENSVLDTIFLGDTTSVIHSDEPVSISFSPHLIENQFGIKLTFNNSEVDWYVVCELNITQVIIPSVVPTYS